MNQNFYNSNSSGFDQFQPPQYPVIHQPPQETSAEMLQARENLMEAIQGFLKKYDQIPSEEKCIALLRAEEKFLKVKQAFEEEQNQPEVTQELLLQLIHDLQLLNEIQLKQAEEKGINKQSEVTFDNESECDLPIFDDFSSLYNSEDDYVIFSRPLFDSYGDTTSIEYSSDNESILEEDVFSNLPFEFDEESISSDVNPIYDEILERLNLMLKTEDSVENSPIDLLHILRSSPVNLALIKSNSIVN
ncbi:hypothetical protein Tco_0833807 [Tanacetum coccineum]